MIDLAKRLERILRSDPIVWQALTKARDFALPDWWIVSGAVYNTVWNSLTGRQSGYGIKDIDLFYFDPDTSWDAEDREIRRGAQHFASDPPVEIRNQARVHLWYEGHFGQPIAPLTSCRDSILNFASRTHAVGVKLEQNDQLTICAPFGLSTIFEMRMAPNRRNRTRQTHIDKAAHCKLLWPELSVEPWSDEIVVSRPDKTTNWADVHQLLRKAFAFMEERIDPPSSLNRLTATDLAEKAKIETCLLAHDDNDLRGCVFCKPDGDDLYIGKLAVDPAYHGKGIGRVLIEEAAAEARAFGQTALLLQTRVELSENHEAFARLGFEKIAETAHPGYERPTSITMRRAL